MSVLEVKLEFGVSTERQLVESLLVIGEAMVGLDMIFLRDRQEGQPCCLGCGGVRAVNHHGTYAMARSRTHRCGAALLNGRAATCLDAAAWSVAEARSEGRSAYIQIVPLAGPGQFHALAVIDGVATDPHAELAAG